jgi:hypothetical protein
MVQAKVLYYVVSWDTPRGNGAMFLEGSRRITLDVCHKSLLVYTQNAPPAIQYTIKDKKKKRQWKNGQKI